MQTPAPTPPQKLVKFVGRWALRLVSIYIGGRIVYHEVWQSETAEPIVLGLGLWFIGVPPALWMDGVRRLGRFAQVIEQAGDVMQEAKKLENDDDPPGQEPQCESSTGT